MSDELKNMDPVELLPLYITGEVSPEQKAAMEAWIAQSEENRKLFLEYQASWNSIDRISPLHTIDLNKEWENLRNNTLDKAKLISLKPAEAKSRSYAWMRIAASIALVAVAGYILFSVFYSNRTITVFSGNEIKSVELPDKTEIALNRNSTLSYKKNYGEKDRTVSLAGEAFFMVTHDPNSQFTIKTAFATIEDLGTSFNVNARNEMVEVVVSSGKVAMTSLKKNEKKIILEKGDRGVVNAQDGTSLKTENKDPNFISWKTGNLAFNNDSLGYVIQCIKNTFHAEIILSKENLKNCRITVSFENQPLDDILEILKATLGLSISKKDGQFIIDGPGC